MQKHYIELAKEAKLKPVLIPVHIAAKVPNKLREERKRLTALYRVSEGFQQMQLYFRNQLVQVEAALSVYENKNCALH